MAATGIITLDTDRLGAEYRALTQGCGLVDRSERGKLALSGPGAKEFLAGQVTNDIEALGPGSGCYAALLTPKGKMLGDLRVLDVCVGDPGAGDPGASDPGAGDPGAGDPGAGRPPGAGTDDPGTGMDDPGAVTGSPGTGTGSPGDGDGDTSETGEELLLDTERIALQALFDTIRKFKIGFDVQLHKRTLERGMLSLIGPDAARVAGVDAQTVTAQTGAVRTSADQTSADAIAGAARLAGTEHANAPIQIGDVTALAVRTDMGIDLICDAADTSALAQTLTRERGAVPVSEEAAEIVRVERGRPRYGTDMDDTTIPQEAGLNERAVSFTKGCYVGQETVARLHYRGRPNRHLRGLRLSEPVPAGAELRLGERAAGRLTSAVVSPAYGPIGLGLVRREAEPGMRVSIALPGAHPDASAEIVELPFAARPSPNPSAAPVSALPVPQPT